MEEKILFKSKNNIDYGDFIRLMSLHKKYDWLYNSSEGLYDLWDLCENENQKSLIETLISGFFYANSSHLLDAGNKIAQQIENTWSLSHKNTYLVATCDNRKPDGSQAFIQSLKNKFSHNWQDINFYNSILEGVHKINDDSNVILVDDFIGTGDTIKSKFQYLTKKFEERDIQNYNVKIISFAAMEFSKKKLDELDVDYFSSHWLKKGISELIVDQKEQRKAIKNMRELENKLSENYGKIKLAKHNFGYKQSESLFSLESYNVPNNVFPIFWWPQLKDKTYHKTIFKRL